MSAPCIPTSQTMKEFRQLLNTSEGTLHNTFLKLVLNSINFEFNGDHYLQIGGTAMGTALAPNYANLFIDRFETRTSENWQLKPLLWLRFIYDIFMI